MFETICLQNSTCQADKALVFLHGLGASAADIKPFFADLDFTDKETFQFIFPQAPRRPVTLANGMQLPAWFDLFAVEKDAHEDQAGIIEASHTLDALLDSIEQQGIARNRIMLGGFSQGGALALYHACFSTQQLAGAIALSTYLPLRKSCPKASSTMPIFMSHGTADNVLPFDFGKDSYTILVEQGFNVAWHEYPSGHQLDHTITECLTDWLSQQFTA